MSKKHDSAVRIEINDNCKVSSVVHGDDVTIVFGDEDDSRVFGSITLSKGLTRRMWLNIYHTLEGRELHV